MKLTKLVEISFFWKHSGLISFYTKERALHLGVLKSDWVWGKEEWWYDGPIIYWGFGPFFLYVWSGR